ncbi:gluconokinase [Cohnella yongneupensis]|uniref:Gluconokinase n=1 Tax=Cohnella yongneupensis TaxID=425006 RepID=A0ABW0QYP6_9BACL
MAAALAIVGIDIGTTSTKSVVFGADGAMLGSCNIGYPLLHEQPGWAEQDPEEIFRVVLASVKGAIADSGLTGQDVAGIGFSTAMHSLIAVSAGGLALTPCITWADGRSELQARRIAADNGTIYRRTGTPVHPMSPLPKIVWLRENQPNIFAAAAKFVSIKEFVVFHLFGEWVVDTSIASATGMLALDSLTWDAEALRVAGITADRLSVVREGTFRLQGMKTAHAEAMGISADTPLFLGGSDGALANIGVGAIDPGELAVTIGTSAAVRMMTGRPMTDPNARTFCYSVMGPSYVIGGATNNGGIVLQWLRESLFGGMGGGSGAGAASVDSVASTSASVEELFAGAARVSPGANGLLFLPFLSGERAPIWNAEARGTFFGANLGHRGEHFVRAGLEGVMLAVLSVTEALKELAGPAREVRASGGFTKSPLWRQMLADMLGQPVVVPRVTEASALGAAVLAMQGLGHIGSWREAKEWIPAARTLEPDLRSNAVYREVLGVYTRLCEKLPESFAEIADLQRRLK